MEDLRGRLEEALRHPIGSVEEAERAARIAEAMGAFLRAVELAEAALEGGSGAERHPLQGSDLSKMTLHEAAERVLEEAGVPLHVGELGKRIKAAGWRHRRSKAARPDQINYQLAARLPRHPDRFKRVAPNTFALARWNEASARSGRAKPRLGLFKGPGGRMAASLGERAEEPVADEPWRSS